MLTQKLMRLTIAGGSEWVMVLLLVLSVISIAIIIERLRFFYLKRQLLEQLDEKLNPLIIRGDYHRLKEAIANEDAPILQAAIAAHAPPRRDREAAEKIVAGVVTRERLKFERRLTFLGTLGNNAPFIGLFGTVLGIIRAFHDLSLESQTNTSVVMAGISEALVATAIGLFVALPAVLFYNYFQKQVDRTLSVSESLSLSILAGLAPTTTDEPAAQASTASKKQKVSISAAQEG